MPPGTSTSRGRVGPPVGGSVAVPEGAHPGTAATPRRRAVRRPLRSRKVYKREERSGSSLQGMTAEPGKSRYLRRGYLTPTERVRYETRASKWYFFFGPAAALAFSLVGDYVFAVSASSAVPAPGFLATFLAGVPSARIGLVWFGLLSYALVLWILQRRRLLRRHLRTASETAAGTAVPRTPHLLAVPSLALIPSLLGAYGFALYTFSVVPTFATVRRVLLSIGPTVFGALLFGALTAVLLLWIVLRWAQWAQDSYVVTDDRLIKQHARWTLIGRVYDDREIQVRQVRDLDVYQSRPLWRVLGIGTLNIHSLSDTAAVARSGAYRATDPDRVDPYINPELPLKWAPLEGSVDASPGVEWWFAIPDPIRAQREIQVATETSGVPRPAEPTR